MTNFIYKGLERLSVVYGGIIAIRAMFKFIKNMAINNMLLAILFSLFSIIFLVWIIKNIKKFIIEFKNEKKSREIKREIKKITKKDSTLLKENIPNKKIMKKKEIIYSKKVLLGQKMPNLFHLIYISI